MPQTHLPAHQKNNAPFLANGHVPGKVIPKRSHAEKRLMQKRIRKERSPSSPSSGFTVKNSHHPSGITQAQRGIWRLGQGVLGVFKRYQNALKGISDEISHVSAWLKHLFDGELFKHHPARSSAAKAKHKTTL